MLDPAEEPAAMWKIRNTYFPYSYFLYLLTPTSGSSRHVAWRKEVENGGCRIIHHLVQILHSDFI